MSDNSHADDVIVREADGYARVICLRCDWKGPLRAYRGTAQVHIRGVRVMTCADDAADHLAGRASQFLEDTMVKKTITKRRISQYRER